MRISRLFIPVAVLVAGTFMTSVPAFAATGNHQPGTSWSQQQDQGNMCPQGGNYQGSNNQGNYQQGNTGNQGSTWGKGDGSQNCCGVNTREDNQGNQNQAFPWTGSCGNPKPVCHEEVTWYRTWVLSCHHWIQVWREKLVLVCQRPGYNHQLA